MLELSPILEISDEHQKCRDNRNGCSFASDQLSTILRKLIVRSDRLMMKQDFSCVQFGHSSNPVNVPAVTG